MGAETANALISVLRGTTTDGYGDTLDDMQPLYQGIAATLVETAQVVQDPDTQTPRVVRAITALVPLWLGVQTTDRVQDQGGNVYIVVDVITQPSITGATPDSKLILRRVTGSGP